MKHKKQSTPLEEATAKLQNKEQWIKDKKEDDITSEEKKEMIELTMNFIQEIYKSTNPGIANPDYKNIVLVGNTTNGKSTLVSYLLGRTLIATLDDTEDPQGSTVQIKIEEKIDENGNRMLHPQIGDGNNSETTIVKSWSDHINKINYWDCPGFEDARGIFFRMANKFLIETLIEHLPNINFAFIANHDIFSSNDANSAIRKAAKTAKEFFGSIETMNKISDSILFIISKGIKPHGVKPGTDDTNYIGLTAEEYINKFQQKLKVLRKDTEDYNTVKAFIELFTPTPAPTSSDKKEQKLIKICSFPKIVEDCTISRDQPGNILNSDGILSKITNIQSIKDKNISFKDESLSSEGELVWLSDIFNDYALERIAETQKIMEKKLDKKIQEASNYKDLQEYLTQQKKHFKMLEKLNTETSKIRTFIKDLIDGIKNLDDSSCEAIGNEISNTAKCLDFFNHYNKSISISTGSWKDNITKSKIMYKKLLNLPNSNLKDGILEIKAPILSTSLINQKYMEKQNEINTIKTYSFLFIVDNAISAPGLNLAISATRWNIPEQKTINLSYNPTQNISNNVLPANDINSSDDKNTDVPIGLKGGNFYGYAKQVTNSLLIVNVSGGKGANRGFDMLSFEKKKQDLEKTIEELECDLKKIKAFEQFENVYRGDKENLTAASNKILTTNNQLTTKITELNSRIEQIEKILDDALLPESDRTKNQEEQERLNDDKSGLDNELKQNERKLSEINKKLQNIKKYEQLKKIETQAKVAEKNQKEYKALEKKLNKAESKLLLLQKIQGNPNFHISEQEIVLRIQEVNKLEKEVKELLQNDSLQIDEYLSSG